LILLLNRGLPLLLPASILGATYCILQRGPEKKCIFGEGEELLHFPIIYTILKAIPGEKQYQEDITIMELDIIKRYGLEVQSLFGAAGKAQEYCLILAIFIILIKTIGFIRAKAKTVHPEGGFTPQSGLEMK